MQPQSTIPVGLCQCGCGRTTGIAKQTSKRNGTIRGVPVRFCKGHHFRVSSHEDRFWSKVAKTESQDDCWEWTAGCQKSGYGQFSIRTGEKISAHRMAWILTNGDIPDGLCVLHSCDNPPCCNPRHLFTGTQGDNIHDMIRKGRYNAPPAYGNRNGSRKHPERLPRGSKHHNAKLTECDVRKMRQLWNTPGVRRTHIGDEFGITYSNVLTICKRITWKHVE